MPASPRRRSPGGWRTVAAVAAMTLLAAGGAGADTSPRPPIFRPSSMGVASEMAAHSGRLMGIAFSSNGRTIYSLGSDRVLKVWTSALRETAAHRQAFRGDRILPSADGAQIFGLSPDNRAVQAIDLRSGKPTLRIDRAYAGPKAFTLSPDGRRLAVTCNDGVTRVVDAASGEEKHQIGGGQYNAAALAWSPDGRRLAAVGLRRTAAIYDAATGEELFALEGTHLQARDLTFSPDGRLVAIANQRGEVRLYDAEKGLEQLTLADSRGGLKQLAFSRDGKYVAVGDGAGKLVVFETSTGRALRTVEDAHRGSISALAFSPDGRFLATGGSDGMLRLWGTGRGSAGAGLKPKSGYLGIRGAWNDAAKGVEVSELIAGGGAEKAGLQVGDVLTAIAGETFEDFDGLVTLLTRRLEGETIEVALRRGDDELKVKVTLGARPRP